MVLPSRVAMTRAHALTPLAALAAVAALAAGDGTWTKPPPTQPLGNQDHRVSGVLPAGTRDAHPLGDPSHAVSGVLPAGWHLSPHATALAYPVELFTAASYPVRGGRGCGPRPALRDLPPGGALVFAMEYRPARGRLRLHGFPPRPAHLRLRQRDFGTYECAGPTYLLRFRDHGRPIQLHVALGPEATAARRAQVLRFLDSLRFAPLPPPPPDPYAGWPEATDEAGDSFRAPPRWTSAVLAVPRRVQRPRTLFVAAARPIEGLPYRRRPARRRRLPLPPTVAGSVPSVWIVEERPGEPDRMHPPFPRGRPWPGTADLARTPAGYLRAGGSCGGHRFSALLVPGRGLTLEELAAQGTGLSCGVRERQLRLAREPYLGVRCRTANSIACDTVGLAVWLRGRATGLRATIGSRTFALHRGHGFWEASLHPAGLLDPASPLHVTPEEPPDRWFGRHPTSAVVRIQGRLPNGQVAARRLRLPLHPGWG
jgi:hypothetical protein